MTPSTPLRTYVLTERVGSACRLSAADVDFLLAEHRAHLELEPIGRRGFYRLTPSGHVGTIVGPNCCLVIRPKIPIQNLFCLLDSIDSIATGEDHIDPAPDNEALDFLASRLAQ